MDIPINYLAVVASALIPMTLGFFWYGPMFGKQWAHLTGISMDSMQKAPPLNYAIMFVGALLMAFGLDHSLIFASTYLRMEGVSAGLQAGIWTTVSFVAPVMLGVVLWEGKSWKLWGINVGYYLVSLSLMGVLLALWR
ncbi:MAG TPA: DUF1761 domain-containing protein [Candidatus Paceibacterota bacterium]|nr:DUF1761 domain-containing protein [Candidatus Paceibacterota bacterium]